MIQTASPGVPMNLDAGANYRYEAVGETEPEELMEMHARRVEAFTRDRKLTVKPATIRACGRDGKPNFNTGAPAAEARPSRGHGSASSVIPTVMLLWTAVRAGMPWFCPAGILGVAALFAVVRWSILPAAPDDGPHGGDDGWCSRFRRWERSGTWARQDDHAHPRLRRVQQPAARSVEGRRADPGHGPLPACRCCSASRSGDQTGDAKNHPRCAGEAERFGPRDRPPPGRAGAPAS